MYTIVLNKMFSEKKKIFETSFLFRGLSFYGAGCIEPYLHPELPFLKGQIRYRKT
jgi:hypothetical protein